MQMHFQQLSRKGVTQAFVATMAMLRAVLLCASLHWAIGSCTFCDATYSYDLSRLPTTTFNGHSGTRGSTTDPYRRYVISSPCATPQSDLCMTHPTSDPLQMRNEQGLGDRRGPASLSLPTCEPTPQTR